MCAQQRTFQGCLPVIASRMPIRRGSPGMARNTGTDCSSGVIGQNGSPGEGFAYRGSQWYGMKMMPEAM